MKTIKLLKIAGVLAAILTATAPTAGLAFPDRPQPMQERVAPNDQGRMQAERFAHDPPAQERLAMGDHDRMPADRFERIPPMPHKGLVWLKGHWRFDRGQWVWVSGVWRAR